MSRVFANGPGDLGLIPGRVIPQTLKMVLYTSLLNTWQYKVHIEGKVEQSRERSSALPLHLGVVAIEKGAFWSPSTMIANFTYYIYIYIYIYIYHQVALTSRSSLALSCNQFVSSITSGMIFTLDADRIHTDILSLSLSLSHTHTYTYILRFAQYTDCY